MRSQWQDPGYGGMQLALPRMTPVVKVLLIANVAVFLLHDLVIGGLGGAGGYLGFLHAFALAPDRWIGWFPLLPVWQLGTYGFLHGSLGHLLGNMLFLYFLGTMLEEIVGSQRFAVFYGTCIVVAGLAQLVLGLAIGQESPILGASGAILGIVCATATLRPTTRIIFIIVPLTLRTLALLYVAFDVYGLLKEFQGVHSGVASFAHLTGALLGFVAVRRGWIWSDPFQRIAQWRESERRARQADDQARLDEILAKINREGLNSLSLREKAFLKRVSKRR